MRLAALALDGHVVLRLEEIAPTLAQVAQGLAERPEGDRW
jgi:hypothetical protein